MDHASIKKADSHPFITKLLAIGHSLIVTVMGHLRTHCIIFILLTSYWSKELRTCRGLEEQQIASERDWLPEDAVAHLQQDWHATLNRASGFVAAAIGHDLHITETTGGPVRHTVGLIYLKSWFMCKNFPKAYTGHEVFVIIYCTVIPDSLAMLSTLMRFGEQPESLLSNPTSTAEVM